MLEDLFGRTDYYEFPSFEVAIFSLLLSFVLSTIIAVTYKFTYSQKKLPINFIQAIVLSSMVSSMVIMAVGNNLAAGFGIIGAIAIIRFRTLIRDPRNIIFIFASLSVGIATGVYGYAIAISGTLIFSIVAILLHFSPFGRFKKSFVEITFSAETTEGLAGFLDLVSKNEWTAETRDLRRTEGMHRYSFLVGGERIDGSYLFELTKEVQGIADIRISTSDSDEL